MSAELHLPTAPSQSRTARYALQCLLALVCVFLAFESLPPPGPLTLMITGFEWLVLGLVRWKMEAPQERLRCIAAPLAGLGLMVLGALARDAAGLGSLDLAWVAWCGIPVVLLTDASSLRFGRSLPVPFGLLLLCSVAVGLSASATWERQAGRALLLLASCTAVVLFVLSFSESLESRARSAGVISTRQAPAPLTALSRFGLGLSAVVLGGALLGFVVLRAALEAATSSGSPGPDLSRPRLVSSDPSQDWDELEDPSLDWEDLGLPGLPRAVEDPRIVAVVQSRRMQGGAVVDRSLYLRQHVLGEYSSRTAAPFLDRAQDPRTSLLGSEEEETYGLVSFTDQGEYGFSENEAEPSLLTEVVSLEREASVMYEPHLQWMAGRRFEVGADASVWSSRRSMRDPVRFGSSPESYFAEGLWEAAASSRLPTLPAGFEDGPWLERLSRDLLRGDNDLERVRRLAEHLQDTGVWTNPPQWEGSYRKFLEGDRAGLCVHFAQIAALLCRMSGLPARVAVGYLGKEFDAEHQRHVIRARHLHAWLEVEFQGFGWVGFEVTPSRPASGDADTDPGLQTAEGGAVSGAPGGGGSTGRSAAAAGGAGGRMALPALPARAIWLVAGLLGLVLFWVLCAPSRLRAAQLGADRTALLSATARRAGGILQRLERVCRVHSLDRHPAETATSFIGRVREACPAAATDLDELCARYHASRFGGQAMAAEEVARTKSFLAVLPGLLERRRLEQGGDEAAEAAR